MNMNRGEAARWSPGRLGANAQPKMGTRRPSPSRSAEERATYRDRSRAQQAAAEREAPLAEAESVDDQWEIYRKRIEAQGDIFDAGGFITQAGEVRLIAAGLNKEQILYLEHLQRNHAGEVTVVSAGESRDEGPAMSARERPQKLAAARIAAEQALQDRAQAEAERRRQQGERVALGVRVEMNAIRAGKTEEDAARLRKQAEETYDLQQQRAQNIRAAS